MKSFNENLTAKAAMILRKGRKKKDLQMDTDDTQINTDEKVFVTEEI